MQKSAKQAGDVDPAAALAAADWLKKNPASAGGFKSSLMNHMRVIFAGKATLNEYDELTHFLSYPNLKCEKSGKKSPPESNPLGPGPQGELQKTFGFKSSTLNADILTPTYKIYPWDRCKCDAQEVNNPMWTEQYPMRKEPYQQCSEEGKKTFIKMKNVACYGSDDETKHLAAYPDRILVGATDSGGWKFKTTGPKAHPRIDPDTHSWDHRMIIKSDHLPLSSFVEFSPRSGLDSIARTVRVAQIGKQLVRQLQRNPAKL